MRTKHDLHLKQNLGMDQALIDKYLNDECSHAEAKQVLDWLATPEGQQYLEEEIDRDLKALDQFGAYIKTPEPNSEALFDEIQADKSTNAKLRELNKRSSDSQWKKVASIILLVGVLALVGSYYFKSAETEQKIVTTESNEEKTLILPDSSKIVLHHNSRVSYTTPFRDIREINLDGEAYFEVEHDKEKPFIVFLDSSYVKVLGTTFVVSEYSGTEGVEVAVKSGKVELGTQNAAGDNVLIDSLTSDDAIQIPVDKVGKTNRNAKPAITENVDSEELFDWVEGKMIFRNTPLKKVLADLENRYAVRFVVRDKELLDRHFTSSFDDESLQQVLTVLEISLNVSTNRVKDTIYLSK